MALHSPFKVPNFPACIAVTLLVDSGIDNDKFVGFFQLGLKFLLEDIASLQEPLIHTDFCEAISQRFAQTFRYGEGYANIFRCVADKQAQNGRFSLWLWLSLRTHGGPQFLGAEGFRPRLYHSFDRRKQAFASDILQTTNRPSRSPATSIISECPPSSLNPHALLLPATSPSSSTNTLAG